MRGGPAPNPSSGKRERLVAAARQVLHEQGVERTTLADIADAADVPVGNVYYYFKTKDELVAAAIDAHARDIQTTLASLDRHRTSEGPPEGVRAHARRASASSPRATAARRGRLCSELDKRDDGLSRVVRESDPPPDRLGRAAVPLDGTTRRARPRRRPDRRLPRDRAAHQHAPRPRAHDPRGTSASSAGSTRSHDEAQAVAALKAAARLAADRRLETLLASPGRMVGALAAG